MTVNPTDPAVVADVLERAANLIEPEGAWLRGQYAKSAEGNYRAPIAPDACRFCSVGAIAKILGTGPAAAESWIDANRIRPLIGAGFSMSAWNDRHTQSEVVAKLREAAAKARGES